MLQAAKENPDGYSRAAMAARTQLRAATEATWSALARTGKKAGAGTERASTDLGHATGRLIRRAIDEVLLGDVRVTSAAEGRRLLAGEEETEALADEIQRLVVLALPVARALARGGKLVKLPWVILASTTLSIGVALRTGVREIQVLSALIAHRLEQETGAPPDRVLVEKLAIELYLHPKRRPDLRDGKLRLVRLTRKWVLSGVFGRTTQRRTGRALAAAERLEPSALAARWDQIRRPHALAPNSLGDV
jgi:hypothetical protein